MDQANSPTTDKPAKPSRRWFQFSLRTLLILTTVIAALLAWWSYKAHQQRAAVAALERAGGVVKFDSSLPWTGGMYRSPTWPQWLLNYHSRDYFASVDLVWFPPSAGDASLKQNPGLAIAGRLNLSDTQVTDAGLKELKGLPALYELALTNTRITDGGLEEIRTLTALRWLGLDNTRVTDSGLEILLGLTHLEFIDLRGTSVTDAGVARFQKALPNCKIYH